MNVQIDRETADELLRVLSQPQRDPGMIVADRLREALRAALDAPQTTEAIDPDNSRCAVPPAQPNPREAFEAWARTRYGLDDRALELSTDGHYLRSPVDVASEAFKAGFAAGRGR